MTAPTLSFDTWTPDFAPRWQTSGLPDIAVAPLLIVAITGALAIQGTSAVEPDASIRRVPDSTTNSPYVQGAIAVEPAGEATRRAISEIRRISGLTWDQLAGLFDVSRRSIHFWASGKAMNATHERRMMETLAILREADRGDARSNRAALLERIDGATPVDLLAAERFDEARALLGRGTGRRTVEPRPLDARARAARKPPPPGELVDASHETIHRETGRTRVVKPARTRGSGRDR